MVVLRLAESEELEALRLVALRLVALRLAESEESEPEWLERVIMPLLWARRGPREDAGRALGICEGVGMEAERKVGRVFLHF